MITNESRHVQIRNGFSAGSDIVHLKVFKSTRQYYEQMSTGFRPKRHRNKSLLFRCRSCAKDVSVGIQQLITSCSWHFDQLWLSVSLQVLQESIFDEVQEVHLLTMFLSLSFLVVITCHSIYSYLGCCRRKIKKHVQSFLFFQVCVCSYVTKCAHAHVSMKAISQPQLSYLKCCPTCIFETIQVAPGTH